jgi:hypothetical protein
MGQQQLLLLILSAVIVGIAIVMGINMFAENAAQANQDAVMQDCLTLASRAQGWFRRPTAIGGGGGDYNGLNATNPGDPGFLALNFDDVNENGDYSMAVQGGGTNLLITGVGTENPDGAGANLTVQVWVGAAGVDSTKVTQ